MNKLACQISLVIAACLFVLSFPIYTLFWVYPQFTEIITFEKEVSAKQIANHISKMLRFDPATKTLTPESITEDFIATLKEAQLDFDLTKVKIFSSGGEVLYSTDTQDIGALNSNPYFKDIVSKGKIYSKVVHKDGKTLEEETVTKDVVETYIPLMRNRHFVGAFEIYYDITYSGHTLSKFVEKSLIILTFVTVILLGCISLISLSAIRYLKQQIQTEKKLQHLKDQVPHLYNLPPDDGE